MQGIKGAMAAQSEDICEVSIASDLKGMKATKCVVLTISSYLFRLMVLIYFTPDATTKSHFAKANRLHESDMSEQALIDAISEFSNMCCGALSRDLSPIFRHIGMSTPNILDTECASYLHLFKCGHTQHFKVEVNNHAHLHFSLCVSEYSDIDFEVDTTTEDVSTGELELF